VEALLETAGFRMDDGDCLVAASLACRTCLGGDVEWRLDLSSYDATAECVCRACGDRRTVFLTPDQALRLALHLERPLDPTPRPAGDSLGM
jgi:hypothetical protein